MIYIKTHTVYIIQYFNNKNIKTESKLLLMHKTCIY